MRAPLVVALLLPVALLVSGASNASPAFDSPTIRFNKSIGDVRLQMSRDQVEYLYGDTNQGKLEMLDDYFPRGTKYAGKPLYRMTYRVHGGQLRVSYVNNRVKVIDTTSRYYRTVSNVGVGTRIPLGRCHRNRYGGCDYHWNTFAYEPDCGKAWIAGTRAVLSIMYMRRGRVAAVQIGDPDVILYCF